MEFSAFFMTCVTWIGLAINREVSLEALRIRTRLRRRLIIQGKKIEDLTPHLYNTANAFCFVEKVRFY